MLIIHLNYILEFNEDSKITPAPKDQFLNAWNFRSNVLNNRNVSDAQMKKILILRREYLKYLESMVNHLDGLFKESSKYLHVH